MTNVYFAKFLVFWGLVSKMLFLANENCVFCGAVCCSVISYPLEGALPFHHENGHSLCDATRLGEIHVPVG